MNYIGISCGFHDAAISVVDDTGNILFASHSERYSKNKHDKNLCAALVADAMSYVTGDYEIHYYEKPWLKYLRQTFAGERPPMSNLSAKNIIGNDYLNMMGNKKVYTHSHHLSHAAAGFQTSTFTDATVVVIDAIGEFDTITIWDARYVKGTAKYKKLYSVKYPNSIGLFYSAMTQRVGLHPMDEEYIFMGMAAYGNPAHYAELHTDLIESSADIKFKQNLHAGVDGTYLKDANDMDIACSTQMLAEHLIQKVMLSAALRGTSRNLVYSGGVALNCAANRVLGERFDKIWIMPNPGDAGSSLGCALLGFGGRSNFNSAYLGHTIPGSYPVHSILNELLTNKIVGVASGRAEFGPRALGNRSLFADPRGTEIKEKVNEIKRRQQFRPFAPVILEEMVSDYFIMPSGWCDSRYMQVIATCRYPELFPAIVHADGTSRVQTVPKDGSGIRELLMKWYAATGCPMLLNTSLNIRGEPMVNDRSDADRFEKLYGVSVLS